MSISNQHDTCLSSLCNMIIMLITLTYKFFYFILHCAHHEISTDESHDFNFLVESQYTTPYIAISLTSHGHSFLLLK